MCQVTLLTPSTVEPLLIPKLVFGWGFFDDMKGEGDKSAIGDKWANLDQTGVEDRRDSNKYSKKVLVSFHALNLGILYLK